MEEDTIKRLQSFDEACFIEFVNEYKKKVVGLCYSYARDYQEAEDISQEVFLSFYRGIGNFRGECSLSTYLYRITVSRCLDYKRKKSIKGFLTGLAAFADREDSRKGFMHETDNEIIEKNFVQDCIRSLTEELKQPVILHYYAGLTYNEIGEILKISSRAVEGRIYRAKQKLRVELMKGGYNEWNSKEMI